MVNKVTNNKLGLNTKVALKILRDDIQHIVEEYEEKFEQVSPWKIGGWLRVAFDLKSSTTTLCWTSILVLILCGISLIFGALVHDDVSFSWGILQGFIVFVLLGVNMFIVSWDSKLRHIEIREKVKQLVSYVDVCINKSKWREDNYPHLFSPYSPCITLQWTMRDGKLINLPWALLVHGDVIEMRPGQQAPGDCIPLEREDNIFALKAREVYSPRQQHNETNIDTEDITSPKARKPLESKKYVLQETPYITNLKIAFDNALSRPITFHNKMRNILMIATTEHIVLPILLGITIFIGAIRSGYVSSSISGLGKWPELLLFQPVAVCLPLLPLIFPSAWIALNCLGMARIQALFHVSTGKQPTYLDWKLDISTYSPSGVASDPFEENDEESQTYVGWIQLWPIFIDFMRGKGAIPCRSANLLHVLGSVTALCCVDKKGILSWPNPTAEKVFFLRSSGPASESTSSDSINEEINNIDKDKENENISNQKKNKEKPKDSKKDKKSENNDDSDKKEDTGLPQTIAEVLDLTHDHTSPFRLQFDDTTWRKYISSLKPLGLSILLNTCNMDTQEHYTQFCSHVTCEAMHSEHLVPVTNRRCLCELAKQIGFTEQAKEVFDLEQQLCTFRHVQPEMVRRDIKFAKSLSFAKLKFPFPHMVAVVVQNRFATGGGLQLLSQGTADIILDSCVEFWDGKDLRPLLPEDRRKVQDFYQRTSLTAYCTAFAYRPLTCYPTSQLSNIYLELPADSKSLYANNQKTFSSLDNISTTTRSCSEDSINNKTISDVDGCFELQCNQVFVGMVTMQYQAQIDMVQLIEQLERACIRFVHFSKENELRSRVFSEKMGLESGWNCHISLLSERSGADSVTSDSWHNSPSHNVNNSTAPAARDSSHSSLPKYAPTPPRKRHESSADETDNLMREKPLNEDSKNLSFSAPSAINLDFSQVKFQDENLDDKKENTDEIINIERGSKESIVIKCVDLSNQDTCRSLSILTDSTEQSAPINFDMSNRAKLPRGIENIRPHLENIDNVPLLVSLFTDCTPSATSEMLSIMQEYGEVVCAMGSSANADNMTIFMQADASMAVEPLYPQVCQQVPVYYPVDPSNGPSPVELSRTLNSIACSVSFLREDPISIFHLILECRHFMQCMINCMQYWLSSSIALSLVQVIAMLIFLPPLFTTGQILWLQCIVIPLLSLSLIGKPIDNNIMQNATGKNQCIINTEAIISVLWFYGSKFGPACITLICLYIGSLASLCPKILMNNNDTCSMIYPLKYKENSSWNGWGDNQNSLFTLQNSLTLLMVVYLIVISIGFVSRQNPIWNECPIHNHLWLISVLLVIILQICYSAFNLSVLIDNTVQFPGLPDIPWSIYFIAGISPAGIFIMNELVKQQEIKADVRKQKKARLEFGTKLGMNSPF